MSSNVIGSVIALAALVASVGVPTTALAQAREGIHVRGHWVIDVRQPDGTLVERREFENALRAEGKGLLATLLAGKAQTRDRMVSGRWSIMLRNIAAGSNPAPCANSQGDRTECRIEEPGSGTDSLSHFRNLSVVNTTERIGNYQPTNAGIVLEGHVKATFDGKVGDVATTVGSCDIGDIGEACDDTGGFNGAEFTTHELQDAAGVPSPINVTAGQLVQVKVTISFQ